MSHLSISGTFFCMQRPCQLKPPWFTHLIEQKKAHIYVSKEQQLITKEDASAALSFNVSMFVSKACISM